MPFFTYRRADGSFYDASHPEAETDERLPLRPSEMYQWVRDRWVWNGQKVNRTYPEACVHDDPLALPVTIDDLRDVMQVLNEQIETSQYQSRALAELRETTSAMVTSMHSHLEEARPLLETLRGLQTIAKAAGLITRVMRGTMMALSVAFRAGLAIVAFYGVMWALIHGDIAGIKRALGMVFDIPAPPGPPHTP